MNRVCMVLFVLAAAGLFLGCGSGAVKEEQIQVKAPQDPIAQVTPILQNYMNGQPMTSEAQMFPKLVEDLKKVDPAKGEVLAKGLEELQKASPQARPAKAKELHDKLLAK